MTGDCLSETKAVKLITKGPVGVSKKKNQDKHLGRGNSMWQRIGLVKQILFVSLRILSSLCQSLIGDKVLNLLIFTDAGKYQQRLSYLEGTYDFAKHYTHSLQGYSIMNSQEYDLVIQTGEDILRQTAVPSLLLC